MTNERRSGRWRAALLVVMVMVLLAPACDANGQRDDGGTGEPARADATTPARETSQSPRPEAATPADTATPSPSPVEEPQPTATAPAAVESPPTATATQPPQHLVPTATATQPPPAVAPTATPTQPPPAPQPTSTPVAIGGGAPSPRSLDGRATLLADDGTYLGLISSNKYDSDSVCNKYGEYGSKYASTSVRNKYGTYGSAYSSSSAYNKYTSSPPAIILGGVQVGYLTKNSVLSGAIDPDILFATYDCVW